MKVKVQNLLINKFDECFPEKTRTIRDNDQPWISHKIKQLDRRRKRFYRKERKSFKWKAADKLFREECKSARQTFYKKSVDELKQTLIKHRTSKTNVNIILFLYKTELAFLNNNIELFKTTIQQADVANL